MSKHWGHNYFHKKHKCSVRALSCCPFSRSSPHPPPHLPSTFLVHVHGCLGALHVEHRVLAQSLKWGSMSLPPLFLRQTRALAKTMWCWLHVAGIRHWGEVGEAQTLRHWEKGYLFSLLEQSGERKQLLCPEASVFMLKGYTTAYKLKLSQW